MMKRHLFLVLGLVVVGALFFLLVPKPSTKSSPLEKVIQPTLLATATNPPPSQSPSPALPDAPPLNLADGIPTDAKVLTPRTSTASPVQVVTHLGKDFAWGTFVGTVMQESLQLSPAAASNAVVSGTFVSPQHLGHQSFDTISLDHEATTPPGGALKLDLRVLNGANWSGWQELSPADLAKPISVNGWASGWQYRLTFSAPSASASPQVHRVTVTTRNSDAVVTTAKAPATE